MLQYITEYNNYSNDDIFLCFIFVFVKMSEKHFTVNFLHEFQTTVSAFII